MTAVLCVGFALASNYLVKTNIGILASSDVLSNPMAEAVLREQQRYLVTNLMKVFFIVAALLTIVGIYVTHKMAGPIFALQRRMREVVQGDFKATVFKVRRGDEFQELVEAYNEMIFAFDNRFKEYDRELQHFTEVLQKTLDKLQRENVPPQTLIPLQSLLKEAQGHVIEFPGKAEKPEEKKRAA